MPLAPIMRNIGNNLLDRLPADEYDPFRPLLKRVSLDLRQVVHLSDADVTHIDFPTTGLVPFLTVLEVDDPVEAMTVGRNGFVGLAAALGVDTSPQRVICQMMGDTLRLPVRDLHDAMGRGPELGRLLHRFIAFAMRCIPLRRSPAVNF